jgi:hypothetical protein
MRPDGSDRGGVADHHDEVAPTQDLHLEHAEAVLEIVEGDALDRARQSLKPSLSALRVGRIIWFVVPASCPPATGPFSSSPCPFGVTLLSSICPVSVRLGQHYRALVMRHVEGACDVTNAFGTVLSSFKTPPAQAHEVARTPPEAGSRNDPRAAGGPHQGGSCSTHQGAAEGARITSASGHFVLA